MEEFDEIDVENKLHIIISVKDFRAILQHAQMISGALEAHYSTPGRPMKLQYEADAIVCEFILMTVGEKDTTAAAKAKTTRAKAPKSAVPALEATSQRGSSVAVTDTLPPAEGPKEPRPPAQNKTPVRPRPPQFEIRPPPVPPQSTARSEGLFVTQDDDQQWDPANLDEEEEEERDTNNARLEWDASNQPVRMLSHYQNFFWLPANSLLLQFESTMRMNSYLNTQASAQDQLPDRLPAGLEPTQRLSEVRRFGLFSP